MRVSGTPQRPKPPARRVELERISLRADEAEGRILFMWERLGVDEKGRAWWKQVWRVRFFSL